MQHGDPARLDRRLKFTACPGSIIWFRRCSCRSSYASRTESRGEDHLPRAHLSRSFFLLPNPLSDETQNAAPRASPSATGRQTWRRLKLKRAHYRFATLIEHGGARTDGFREARVTWTRLFRSIRHEIAVLPRHFLATASPAACLWNSPINCAPRKYFCDIPLLRVPYIILHEI